jgi:menaquinone-dependent protoporphyrinogen IX oxidase
MYNMKEKEVRNVSETYRHRVVTSFWRDSVYTGILAGKLRYWPFCYKRPLSFQAGFVRPKNSEKLF